MANHYIDEYVYITKSPLLSPVLTADSQLLEGGEATHLF